MAIPRKVFAIKKSWEERLNKLYPTLNDNSGIYFFTRYENGLKYSYVGQAKHLRERIISHLMGYSQHIDISLKKRGLYDLVKRPDGWQISFIEKPIEELDKWERYYISNYANGGWQLYNATIGGQDKGKSGLGENKPTKNYHDGLKQGEKNAYKTIRELFDKYLNAEIKQPTNKIKERKLKEFEELIYESDI